ncbi:hypothetical protein V3W47_14810 [Deinococcus sp. YIM 134068]|uniref:hypothetical protein n=1 Tax=Deinococcus lichenicola TaxID=3118910 RepID=UPI002F922CAA
MTNDARDDGQRGQKQRAEGGDVTAEGTEMTDGQMAQLGARPGRGASEVAGADPSDEYVFEHVEGEDAQGPKLPTTQPD